MIKLTYEQTVELLKRGFSFLLSLSLVISCAWCIVYHPDLAKNAISYFGVFLWIMLPSLVGSFAFYHLLFGKEGNIPPGGF